MMYNVKYMEPQVGVAKSGSISYFVRIYKKYDGFVKWHDNPFTCEYDERWKSVPGYQGFPIGINAKEYDSWAQEDVHLGFADPKNLLRPVWRNSDDFIAYNEQHKLFKMFFKQGGVYLTFPQTAYEYLNRYGLIKPVSRRIFVNLSEDSLRYIEVI